ncbi:hypothetical protein Ancab_008581 [Ancistrocladus abbreviatus]
MEMGLSLAIAVALGALSLLFFCLRSFHSTKLSNQLPPVPKVSGLPLLGNLLQLKDKKPFKTFTRWAQIYGPIYSIKLGSSSMIVLNNNDVAKEICVNLHGCNKDKNKWKNPEVWNPERFLVDEYEPQDLYKTMAFGAGKRVCTGALQAMLIVCLSIGRLVQDFEWRLEGGEEEDLDIVGFTTHKLHPLHAIIKPRS